MSVHLYSARERGPEGTDATLNSTTVGGNKPLHRFLKGQPKIVGIVVLILGLSFFVNAMGGLRYHLNLYMLLDLETGFIMGIVFIICGILYIFTEHNPTKRTVTASLAVTITALLGTVLTLLTYVAVIGNPYNYQREDHNATEIDYSAMEITSQLILTIYGFGGIIIFIVMSTLAIASLRSTKSQTVVMMTTSPTETPAQ